MAAPIAASSASFSASNLSDAFDRLGIEGAPQVEATEERIIAAVRGGMDPVAAHETVNDDNMLKAQGG